MGKFLKSQEGAVSIIATVCTLAAMFVAAGLIAVTISNASNNKNIKDTVVANYAAESGAKRAMACINRKEAVGWLADDEEDYTTPVYVENPNEGKDAKRESRANYNVHVYSVDDKTGKNHKDISVDLNQVKNEADFDKVLIPGKEYYIISYGYANDGATSKSSTVASVWFRYNGDKGFFNEKGDDEGDDGSGGNGLEGLNDPKTGKGPFDAAIYSDTEVYFGAWDGSFNLKENTCVVSKGSIPGNRGNQYYMTSHGRYDDQLFEQNPLPIDFVNYPSFGYQMAVKMNDDETDVDSYLTDLSKSISARKYTKKEKMNKTDDAAVNINGKAVEDSGNLKTSKDIVIENSIVKDIDLIQGRTVTIKNSYVVANTISASNDSMKIENSIVEVKDLDMGKGSSMDKSLLVATGNLDLVDCKITNSRIEAKGNVRTEEALATLNNSYLKADGNFTVCNGFTAKDAIIEIGGNYSNSAANMEFTNGILKVGGSLSIRNGLTFNNVYVEANGIDISCNSDVRNSIISSLGNLAFNNGHNPALDTSVLLAKGNIDLKGACPEKIKDSLVKSYNGKITLGNTLELEGIMIAKDIIKFSQGNESIKYSKAIFNLTLDLGNILSDDSELLKPLAEKVVGLSASGNNDGNNSSRTDILWGNFDIND